MAKRVGITGPAVRWHLDRLLRAGLVLERRDGRRLRFEAAAPALAGSSAWDAG